MNHSMPVAAGILDLYAPPLRWLKPSSSSSSSAKSPFLFTISCVNRNLNKTLSQIQSSGVIACLRAPSGSQWVKDCLRKQFWLLSGMLSRKEYYAWIFKAILSRSEADAVMIVWQFFQYGLHAFKHLSAELALRAAHAALDNGISVLEVVVSCPGVFEVIKELVQQHPTKTIGVGTVLNAVDAKRAIQSGVEFLMSPAMVQDVFDSVCGTEVLYIPGVMTPTELVCAHNAGSKIVKVYPVSAIGGAQYIRALTKPFPHIPVVASQGITIDSIPEYIAGGASAVVLSDAIFDKNAVSQGDLNTISNLARHAAFLANEAVNQFRLAQQVSGHS